MKTSFTLAAGFAVLLGCLSGAPVRAQSSNLNQRDKLLLYYYNYYKTPRDTRQLAENQERIRNDLSQFRDVQNQRANQPDPLDQYVREGRELAPNERTLPPIYAGGGGRKQYFMRINYFNPPQRQPRGF